MQNNPGNGSASSWGYSLISQDLVFFAIFCDDRESVARAIVREKSWQLSYLWIELTELRHTCIDVQVVEFIGHMWKDKKELEWIEMTSFWHHFIFFGVVLSFMQTNRNIPDNMWDISVWMYDFFSLAIYTISQPLPCVHDMATINHHFVSWKNVK